MEALEAEIGHLLETNDLPSAAAAIVRGYGPAILGYLAALARDEDRADDVFSQFCEDLWRGLPGFRRDASVRTWTYKLAWHAWLRNEREAYHRRGRPFASEEISRLAAEVRFDHRAAPEIRGKGCGRALARAVGPGRADAPRSAGQSRACPWSEVAAVMSTPEEHLDAQTVAKRFQRVKGRLRKLAEEAGLLGKL